MNTRPMMRNRPNIYRRLEQLEQAVNTRPPERPPDLSALTDDELRRLEELQNKYGESKDLSLWTDDELREMVAIQKKVFPNDTEQAKHI